jgi:hypothetical protein
MYPAYAMLSHDVAHGPVTALRRHYRQGEKGLRTVEVLPAFKPGERPTTVDLASDMVLGACIGVSQILGGTSQNDALRALFERFERQGRRAAPPPEPIPRSSPCPAGGSGDPVRQCRRSDRCSKCMANCAASFARSMISSSFAALTYSLVSSPMVIG